ncbi:MAG: ThaI family type II restriction endonuclease [Candidatus Micrarchaeaceae archaeon]
MPKQLKNIGELFTDKEYTKIIKKKLPRLFNIAGIESSRAGKIGMQVGSLRENVLISLLFYAFGEGKVNADFAITTSEKDVEVNGNPISIKTITENGSIKASWTVDAGSATKFVNSYKPNADILLAQIFWGKEAGGLFLIPKEVQLAVFNKLGKGSYLKMPKAGTNPRGIEFTRDAITEMLKSNKTKKILIKWNKDDQNYNVYTRWIDYWKES